MREGVHCTVGIRLATTARCLPFPKAVGSAIEFCFGTIYLVISGNNASATCYSGPLLLPFDILYLIYLTIGSGLGKLLAKLYSC